MKYLLALVVAFILCAASWQNDSIFMLQSDWTSDSGSIVKLSSLGGNNVLLTLIYTHCSSVCPVTIHRLQQVKALAEKANRPLTIGLVSMDSNRDSPKRLAGFRQEKALSQDWKLLAGTEEAVRELSVLLGFSYQRDDKTGEFQHSNRIVLLDNKGTIQETFDGMNVSAEEIVDKLHSPH